MKDNSGLRRRFELAAATYDIPDGIQPEVAGCLAGFLPKQLPETAKILEIGCGTGNLTELLRDRYPLNPFWVTDMVPAMVTAARDRMAAKHGSEAPTIWQAVDVRSFTPTVAFDLITSSSALHWVDPLPETIHRLSGWLTDKGQFIGSIMIHGTLAELHEIRRRIAPAKIAMKHKLPTEEGVMCALQDAGLRVKSVEVREFNTSRPSCAHVLRMLRLQGVSSGFYGSGAALNRTELRQLISEYDHVYADAQGVRVSWRVLFFQCERSHRL